MLRLRDLMVQKMDGNSMPKILSVLPTDLEEVKAATFELNWLLEN